MYIYICVCIYIYTYMCVHDGMKHSSETFSRICTNCMKYSPDLFNESIFSTMRVATKKRKETKENNNEGVFYKRYPPKKQKR